MERDAKERIKKRVTRAIVVVAFAWWLPGQLPAYGQSAEDQARIDYESAKLAFVKGDFRLALSKVESVMQVLGPEPTLLTFAAGAAFENRDVSGARGYAKRAYAAADPMFKGSEPYQQLVALSARIELEGAAIERQQAEAHAREQQAAAERAATEARAAAERRASEARQEQLRAQATARAQVVALGYWIDRQTTLMWTASDNGLEINGKEATKYCRELVLAGHDDWRLPTYAELKSIYDPSLPNGAPKIKRPLALSRGGWSLWSGTKSKATNSSNPRGLYHLYFNNDIEVYHGAYSHPDKRVMCVRPSES